LNTVLTDAAIGTRGPISWTR